MIRKTVFFAALALLFLPASAFAGSGNWNTNASGDWSLAGNWAPVGVPGTAAGDTVGLSFNITQNRTVTIDNTSRTVGTLNIGDTDASDAYNLAASGGASLTFDVNAGGGRAQPIGR